LAGEGNERAEEWLTSEVRHRVSLSPQRGYLLSVLPASRRQKWRAWIVDATIRRGGYRNMALPAGTLAAR
jgi:hypothetical protein